MGAASGKTFMIYTNPSYRRQGYGLKLIQEVQIRRSTNLIVTPWDRKSEAFFKAVVRTGIPLSYDG